MARPKTQGPRVLGPYPDREGFRIIEVKKDGTRDSRVFPTEAEAIAEKDRLTIACQRPMRAIREAMKAYLTYMLEDKGNKERSVDQTKRKLMRFSPTSRSFSSISMQTCAPGCTKRSASHAARRRTASAARRRPR